MKQISRGILAFDTSNYTTSAAVVDDSRNIVVDIRKGLEVKQGDRGLRQSYALFQHIENLPFLIERVFQEVNRDGIKAVAVSNKPRPLKDSYMPVFRGGEGFARAAAAALGVPLFCFSHQEGHLAAAGYGTSLERVDGEYLAYHLSGGTCELLLVQGERIEIIGGTKDISFGQLIDRAGVAMGMQFPAGSRMDAIALKIKGCNLPAEKNPFKPIALDGLRFNVSGIETQFIRALKESGGEEEREFLVYWLFRSMLDCLAKLTVRAAETRKNAKILFSGGVSSSRFLREGLAESLEKEPFDLGFGMPQLSSDNAVGIALLGGQALWR
ncbi:MAG: hypothetical protein SOY83_04280 [Anaerovoracaceae bacterium]|nr:hypothetical protein [Anaerovoracaceae bacterium]